MAKKNENKIEINLNVASTESNLKQAKDDLSLILKDTVAINRAIAETNQYNKEGAIILGRALTSELLGPIGSLLDLYVDLSLHSKESVSFFEKVQKQLILISKTEHQHMLAQVEIGNLVKSEAENEIARYTRNENYQKEYLGRKLDEKRIEIRNIQIREEANKKVKKLYQEEFENLEENQAAYFEINDAIKRINDQKGRSLAIQVTLGGQNIKVEQKAAKLALENLEIRKRTYATKIKLGEEAQLADLNAQHLHQEALENSKERQNQMIAERQTRSELTDEEQKQLEEHNKRIAELFDANPIEGIHEPKIEQVKAREAIKIEEIDKEKLFASEREKITKEVEQTESDSFDKRLDQHEEYNEDADELQQQNSETQQEMVEQTNNEVVDSEANSQKTRLEQWKDYAEKAAEISRKISEATGMVTSSLGGMFGQLGSYYADQVQAFADKIAVLDEEKEAALERVALSEEERQAKEEEIAMQKIELEYATSDEQRAKADERIATLQDELSAEDTINREFGDKKAELEKEKAKKEVEQKKAEKMEKRLQMSQAIVEAIGDVAAGAAKALKYGPILGPIMAAIVSAAGAVQVGIMSKQLTKMKDGGLLRGLSHARGGMPILGSNVEVEGGEYVVNKQSTSKNLGLLEYINGERRGLGYMDMNTYFGEQSVPPSFLSQMMNEPSVVPQLPMKDSVDTQILNAIERINFQPRVSVTDINTVHDNMVKVDEWTGL